MTLKIKNNWNYVGDDRWDWEAFIDDGGSGEISDINFVEYVLHPTFPNPIRKVKDQGTNFRLKSNGWGTFRIKAFAHMKDGNKVRLEHELELYYEPQSGTSD